MRKGLAGGRRCRQREVKTAPTPTPGRAAVEPEEVQTTADKQMAVDDEEQARPTCSHAASRLCLPSLLTVGYGVFGAAWRGRARLS